MIELRYLESTYICHYFKNNIFSGRCHCFITSWRNSPFCCLMYGVNIESCNFFYYCLLTLSNLAAVIRYAKTLNSFENCINFGSLSPLSTKFCLKLCSYPDQIKWHSMAISYRQQHTSLHPHQTKSSGGEIAPKCHYFLSSVSKTHRRFCKFRKDWLANMKRWR